MKMTAEEAVLRRLGVDFQSPAPGCCGMAGSFGFEPKSYDMSIAIGELELLPAVRQAPSDWLIIADGFSCREQIAQGTRRHAFHLAEVLQMALHEPDISPSHPYPESARTRQRQAEVFQSMKRAGLGWAALAAGALLWKASRRG
jgi:Fe-S oxidoreductase